jgi:hypothetical protein
MNKLPFIPLYVNDWSRDLEEHPLEIEGAWFRIVCKLWWEGGTGEALKPIEAWAKILRVDNDTAKRVLDYIGDVKIGDISYSGDANVMAKVECRRMKRDWNIRQERSVAGAMGAKARWQTDGKGHGKPHGKRMKYDICNMKSDSDIEDKKEGAGGGEKPYEKLFEQFWEGYPKKVARAVAREKFMILARAGKVPAMIKAVNGYMDYLKNQRVKKNFEQEPMHPSTFLSKDRWKDYIDFKYEADL